jgi:uncharacterized protein (TIGR02231 family)
MNLKSFYLFIFTAFCFQPIFANVVEPKIKEVTIFNQGAKIESECNNYVSSGKSELKIGPIYGQVATQAIQVSLGASAMLQSMRFVPSNEVVKPTGLLKTRIDSLQLLQDMNSKIQLESEVLRGEESMILSQTSKGQQNTPLTLEQLRSYSDFYRSRVQEIKDKNFDLTLRRRKIDEMINRIQILINADKNNQPRNFGHFLVTVQNNTAQSIPIKLSYLVYGPSWNLNYELRAEGTGKPLDIVYKATVQQFTGLDWKDVKLKFSTGNISENNSRPILNPAYIDFIVPQMYAYNKKQQMNSYQLRNQAMAPAMESNLSDNVDKMVFSEDKDVVSVFEVMEAQTLISSQEMQYVQLDKRTIKDLSYQYHTVPKLDPSVFLLAELTNFSTLDLQPGNASIFYRGSYVGETFLDPRITGDTLLVSLGKDDRVSVKRHKPEDLTKPARFLGTNKLETITYEIIVRNNKTESVELDVLDQIPVSRNTDLEVELIEAKDAQYTKEFGKLLWKIKLEPNATRKLRFTYTLKYPKNKSVGSSL